MCRGVGWRSPICMWTRKKETKRLETNMYKYVMTGVCFGAPQPNSLAISQKKYKRANLAGGGSLWAGTSTVLWYHIVGLPLCYPSNPSSPGALAWWKPTKHISKSKCAKHTMVGPLLEVEMSKKCTPLWREAHFEVKMYKTFQPRTTFGSWDVEKVHAVVARFTFRSENVQNISALHHSWKLRCRKSARRCGAKHISKSKCTKHLSLAPLLEDYLPLHFTTLHSTTTTTTTTQLHSTTLHHTPLH